MQLLKILFIPYYKGPNLNILVLVDKIKTQMTIPPPPRLQISPLHLCSPLLIGLLIIHLPCVHLFLTYFVILLSIVLVRLIVAEI